MILKILFNLWQVFPSLTVFMISFISLPDFKGTGIDIGKSKHFILSCQPKDTNKYE